MNFHAPFLPALSVLLLTGIAAQAAAGNNTRLQLHPRNPHCFLFRGKPTVLITSGEHYGAVLNLDFDYVKYLDTLAKDGLNLTRTFAGAYCEPPGAFNIASNTLAPSPNRFICPWARSDRPGYANGGNKFDLTKWDEAYFKRLKAFVAMADKRGIVAELNGLDNVYYEICNEPYFGGVTMEWQHHIADVIVETEKGLPGQRSKKRTP